MDLNECYAILGLAPGDSPADIRHAYKREVLKCHPDRTPGDAENHARFCRITAAYSRIRAAGFAHGGAAASERTCAACGNADELLLPSMNGTFRCSACLLDRRRKRLPGPPLRSGRCLAVIGLQALAGIVLARAMQTESNTEVWISAVLLLAAMLVLTRDVCRSVVTER